MSHRKHDLLDDLLRGHCTKASISPWGGAGG